MHVALGESKSQLLMMTRRHVGNNMAGERESAPIADRVLMMITSMARYGHQRWIANSLS